VCSGGRPPRACPAGAREATRRPRAASSGPPAGAIADAAGERLGAPRRRSPEVRAALGAGVATPRQIALRSQKLKGSREAGAPRPLAPGASRRDPGPWVLVGASTKGPAQFGVVPFDCRAPPSWRPPVSRG